MRVGRLFINTLLDFLSDAQWHTLAEISNSLNLPAETRDAIIQFLSNYELIDIDDHKIRIRRDFHELIYAIKS
jgi:hypothetical protein